MSENYDDFEETDARRWAAICHLGGFAAYTAIPFAGVLAPLIIWLIKKDESAYIDDQGKEAINFQITMGILFFIATLLLFVVIGCFIIPVLAIAHIILMIMAALAASEGKTYRYPFALRLIK